MAVQKSQVLGFKVLWFKVLWLTVALGALFAGATHTAAAQATPNLASIAGLAASAWYAVGSLGRS